MKPGTLTAVDGTSTAALAAAARAMRADGHHGARISEWDASHIFAELAEDSDGRTPSARVLLLLYATDLAFRLRRDIEPALAEGQRVIAAPYVATAIALGRAAGLRGRWLANLFRFAPPADDARVIAPSALDAPVYRGFVELGCECLGSGRAGLGPERLRARAAAFLTKTRHDGHPQPAPPDVLRPFKDNTR